MKRTLSNRQTKERVKVTSYQNIDNFGKTIVLKR